ncbi:MAG TPA: hypothetical protein VK709_13960 [Candidatus Saccharimonadales bacterium]|nr:hypothetical protein [Candidatus Saccharimonadales bacterium]
MIRFNEAASTADVSQACPDWLAITGWHNLGFGRTGQTVTGIRSTFKAETMTDYYFKAL